MNTLKYANKKGIIMNSEISLAENVYNLTKFDTKSATFFD